MTVPTEGGGDVLEAERLDVEKWPQPEALIAWIRSNEQNSHGRWEFYPD